jgi:hypothetical protein
VLGFAAKRKGTKSARIKGVDCRLEIMGLAESYKSIP